MADQRKLPDDDDGELLELLAATPDTETLRALVTEANAQGRNVTAFVCGAPRRKCYRCATSAVVAICNAPCNAGAPVCNAPADAAPAATCGKPLCAAHSRGGRCAMHAPMTTTTNMPKPPGRA